MIVIPAIMDILETWIYTARTQALSNLIVVEGLLKDFAMMGIFQGMGHQIIQYTVLLEMVRPY